MEGELSRRGNTCPQLLDLIPNGKKEWMVKDTGGGGGGFEVAEERKLELRLGLPVGEDWSSLEEKKHESALSLGSFPKSSKTATNTNPSTGAKRVLLDTVESKPEGLQQQPTAYLQLQSISGPQRTSGKAEQQQQSLERKACCPSPSAASHAAPRNAAGASNTSHTRRTTSVPVVGWPPIRSCRKNIASSSSKPPPPESQDKGGEAAVKLEDCRKGLFVKINMEGIPIGRKVDLKAYESYDELSSAVEELFQGLLAVQRDPTSTGIQNAEKEHSFTGLLDGSGEYTLVYEDNEGDRMLVGDVPWDMFVSTAKRLRVLKSSELTALSLGAVSRKRTATDC